MNSPALLLFLDLEGVLILNESIKRSQVEEAIRTIASGKSRWKDYQELWDGLFEPKDETAARYASLHRV